MWLGVITLFPDMFDSVCREGVFSRAIESGVVSMRFFNPRDYTSIGTVRWMIAHTVAVPVWL